MKSTLVFEKVAKSAQKQTINFAESTISMVAYYTNGFEYKLVHRKGNVALFEQFSESGKPVAFEVIIIQSNTKKEYAPKTEDWGRLGWSYRQYENALRVYKRMTEHQIK